MRQSPSPRGDRTLDHSMCYHMSNHQGQIKQYEWPGLPSKTMFCQQDWVDQFVWFESCSSDPMDQSRVKFKSIPFQFCPPLLWETSCRTMAPRSRPWRKRKINEANKTFVLCPRQLKIEPKISQFVADYTKNTAKLIDFYKHTITNVSEKLKFWPLMRTINQIENFSIDIFEINNLTWLP